MDLHRSNWTMPQRTLAITIGLFTISISTIAEGRVTEIEITRVESPTFEGRSFGDVGQYEKLVGIDFGEVDPNEPLNSRIVNLDLAPRNDRGMVEYQADVYILKPLKNNGNHTIFYEVNNRGSKLIFASPNHFFVGAGGGNNPTTPADAGDGFLMRLGYTLVWSGWLGNLLPGGDRVIARLPVATKPGGEPITHLITTDFVFSAPAFTIPIAEANTILYRPVVASMNQATLYRSAGPHHGPREVIPRNQWSFARCPDGVTITPTQTDICLSAGFSTDAFYELVYEGSDPIVLGLGFAAMRDVVSFLKYDRSASNPLHAPESRRGVRRAIAYGSSQSGRAIRDIIYQGFNQDENGRMVFDGAIPHVGGSRKTWTNFEFGLPGKFSQGVENHWARGDQFPFAYSTITDPITGRADGILQRCREQRACPKIMQFDSASEPWIGRFSLVVTDPLGRRDLAIPDNVRIYQYAGNPHLPSLTPARAIMCKNLTNPARFRETQRALLVAMQDWITKDKEPPPSRFPTIRDATLVSSDAVGFPAIPGVKYTGRYNDLFVLTPTEPPEPIPGMEYRILVPLVDEEGNGVGGVRSVTIQAPLGTYTGWNPRRAGFMESEPGGGCDLSGSFIPFATTKAQRIASGDPRPSLEERYGSHAGYVQAVELAAKRLHSQRLLLEEDVTFFIEEAVNADIGLR